MTIRIEITADNQMQLQSQLAAFAGVIAGGQYAITQAGYAPGVPVAPTDKPQQLAGQSSAPSEPAEKVEEPQETPPAEEPKAEAPRRRGAKSAAQKVAEAAEAAKDAEGVDPETELSDPKLEKQLTNARTVLHNLYDGFGEIPARAVLDTFGITKVSAIKLKDYERFIQTVADKHAECKGK